MAVVKNPVVKKAVPKAPPKPKFMEVGFKFPVMVEIVSTAPEDDEYEYPVVVRLEMGGWEDWDNVDGNRLHFKYPSIKDFKDFYAKCDPKFIKTQKQEELKQAQALVAKLTKEINELK